MKQSTTAKTTIYVGLDVHKDSIDIALAEVGRGGEVRHLGTVAGGLDAVTKALRRLWSVRATGRTWSTKPAPAASCCSATWPRWATTARWWLPHPSPSARAIGSRPTGATR